MAVTQGCRRLLWGLGTMTHFPARFLSVFSDGAAILQVLPFRSRSRTPLDWIGVLRWHWSPLR